jgi:hypothetical protein
VAGGTLAVGNGYGVNACGAGGPQPPQDASGGGGGGAGGAILIEASIAVITGTLAANGGGGASGDHNFGGIDCNPGENGRFNATRALGGPSSGNGSGPGGDGGAGDTPNGTTKTIENKGGGGGGAAGRIRINTTDGSADLTGSTISPALSTGLFTQGTLTIE